MPSYFLGEDAIIRKYKFWDELKSMITHRCYLYPIVYTDGLISHVVSDGQTRTPYGFALGNYIIPFIAPEEEMTPTKALFQCRNVVFADTKGCLPSVEILRYIRSHLREINKLIEAFDGNVFENVPYLSCDKYAPQTYVAINFGGGQFLCVINKDTDDMIRFRPVINIAHLY